MSRKTLFRLLAAFLFLSLVFLPNGRASADMGPKPVAYFHFSLPDDMDIEQATLLECKDDACLEVQPLPWGAELDCQADYCRGMIFGSWRLQLQVLFSDGQTRLSKPFRLLSYSNVYTVRVRDTDLVVHRNFFQSNNLNIALFLLFVPVIAVGLLLMGLIMIGSNLLIEHRSREAELPFKKAPGWYLLAWVLIAIGAIAGAFATPAVPLNLLIELGVASLYLRFYWHRKRDRIESRGNTVQVHEYTLQNRPPRLPLLTAVATVNLISQPLLWIGIMLATAILGEASRWPLLAAEVGVWLFEAWLLRLLNKRYLHIEDALQLSLFMNLTSFGIGLFLAL